MNIILNLCCGPLHLLGFTHYQNLLLAFPILLFYSFAFSWSIIFTISKIESEFKEIYKQFRTKHSKLWTSDSSTMKTIISTNFNDPNCY